MSDDPDVIRQLLLAGRIAMVGLSDDPARPSHAVAQYLISRGKEIIPVNPSCKMVLGLPCYPMLKDVPGRIDLVDVFRRPEHCPQIVSDAIARGVGGIWLQAGITSEESRQLAAAAGLPFVQDHCLKVELLRESQR